MENLSFAPSGGPYQVQCVRLLLRPKTVSDRTLIIVCLFHRYQFHCHGLNRFGSHVQPERLGLGTATSNTPPSRLCSFAKEKPTTFQVQTLRNASFSVPALLVPAAICTSLRRMDAQTPGPSPSQRRVSPAGRTLVVEKIGPPANHIQARF